MSKNISISILSGKGGVGKTNIALNLGYALHSLEQKVVILDCDLGLANLNILLGLEPSKNIQDVLLGDSQPEEILISVEKNLDIIASTSGVLEILDLEEDIQFMVEERLQPLLSTYDFILLDLGAGIGASTLAFAAATSLRIIVITPEPTSLTDSYAVIKILKNNYGLKNFFIVVNSVSSEQEAKLSFQRLNTACEKFLGLSLLYLGWVHYDENVSRAIREQKPFQKFYSDSLAASDILKIGKKLLRLTENANSIKKGLSLVEGINKTKET
ncbi:MAG: Site-determining protein [Desulfonauticus sp. 38_4375]|nr:MAG: Site-determining protein [Desulfonauticus sp. 38_4375]